MTPSKQRLRLKLEEWPAADQKAWVMAREPGDVLDPGAPASQWSPASVTWATNAYGYWLGWLKRTGLLDLEGEVAGAICPDAVRDYIAAMRQINASSSVADRIQKLHLMARALCPDKDWEWLLATWRRLQRASTPARDKRARLVDAAELFGLGHKLMEESERIIEADPMAGAILYRDGLMIALLMARPCMRLKNLASLRMGHELTRRGEQFWLQFTAAGMKQRKPVQVAVPGALTTNIERYLAYHRPLLFPRNRNSKQPVTRDPALCAHLWVATTGAPMKERTIYGRLVKLTQERLGKSVNTHLFRDIAATTMAIRDPKHVRSAMNILGHSKFETTEHHYILASSMEASRCHQATIVEMRRTHALESRE